jgi:hypothetical protein
VVDQPIGLLLQSSEKRTVGVRRRDQDSTQAAQRHEATAAQAMRPGILIALGCAGAAGFSNIIVRTIRAFFTRRRATRQARACRREHGRIHAFGCDACHARQVAGGAPSSSGREIAVSRLSTLYPTVRDAGVANSFAIGFAQRG